MICPLRAIVFVSIAGVLLLAAPVTQATIDDGEGLCRAVATTPGCPSLGSSEQMREEHESQPGCAVAPTTVVAGAPREDSSSLPARESRSNLLLHCLLRC